MNLYPPQNGGQLRCFHLMDKLSKHFQIDVICFQPAKSFIEKGYFNENISFFDPKSYVKNEGILKYFPNKIKNALRFRILTKTLMQSATIEVLEFSHIIKELYKTTDYDMVIFEHLSSMSLLPVIKKYSANEKFVLDAHNVDHLLIDLNNRSNLSYYKEIKNKESSFYQSVHEFWACSKNDMEILESLNDYKIKGRVVPNGVDIEDKKYVKNKEGTYNTILFCGTLDAFPNKEGIQWFYKNVWPKIIKNRPYVKLLVVGKGDRTPYSYLEMDSKVDFIGEVEDVGPYYKNSFLAIVPLLSGSGTRLKILEAMSFGNPIVTTSKGIEGIDFQDNEHALIADSAEEFYIKILQILDSPEKGHYLRENAYKLVESKYDWQIIATHLANDLN